jgi:hypothetical protein
MKTGTPMAEKASAMTCSVMVLPVPVAPAMRPCRLASAGSRQTSRAAAPGEGGGTSAILSGSGMASGVGWLTGGRGGRVVESAASLRRSASR